MDIQFDLIDDDNDPLAVAVSASADDGQAWSFPCYSLSGDIGQGIMPGTGKTIVWDLAHDGPDVEYATFRIRVTASDAGVEHTTHSPKNYWIMQWNEMDWTIQENIEKFAKGDVIVVNSWEMWGDPENEGLGVTAKIKAINPDVKIFVYALPKTVLTAWANTTSPLRQALYDRTLPYWSYTTTGDTLFDWPGQVVLNILDPACRRVLVETYAEFRNVSANEVDGIFWDYFARKIWISPGADPLVDGEPDLDGDGIPHLSDPDEQVAFRAAGDSLVMYAREVLGEDFAQVFNGPRAHVDSAFAALGDGMYYEIYPYQVFPDPPVTTSLDPDYEYNLFRTSNWPRSDNGGPYVVLGCIWQSHYVDYNGERTPLSNGDNYRVIGLLTDMYSAWLDEGAHVYSWPDVEINLGQPLGPTTIDGPLYTRLFEYGSVTMELGSGTYPNPFRYVIKCNGQIVEELDVPYHFP